MHIQDRLRHRGPSPLGRIAIGYYDPRTGEISEVARKPNQIQDTWGMIAARAIGLGDRDYRIRGLYIEFENVASPGDPVTVPTYGTDEGLAYYSDLAVSGSRDFLRIALTQSPTLSIETGYEELFEDGVGGNKLTFFGITSGVVGVHGKTFSDSVNSTVFGASLVATPVVGDQTQDVIFARTYFEVADQVAKDPSRQICITWDMAFVRE